MARSAPAYDTPFTRETEPWGARTLVTVQPRHPGIPATALDKSRGSRPPRPALSLSVVSYNVLADCNSVRVRNCVQGVISWGRRREILLKEIFSVRADVLCLQDVDFFQEWWSPQLTSAGYDSVFKKRTSRSAVHREGVVIAWKRDVFDLFRSSEMELNRLGENEEDRSLAGKAATSDNVALMALLQPWEDSDHPSGACVVCTHLHEEEGYDGDALRSLQARGLTRTVEAFNADFTLPVVMCGTMNCVPSSGTYEILCRGVEAKDPARPGVPGKPRVETLSTSAVRLRWAPPLDDSESLSPSIHTYRILWVPGGSRFLPGESVDAHEASCVVYDLLDTGSGKVRSEQNPLRSFIVSGLSSGVAYEFRVAAINGLGQGAWSERSDPVRMPHLEGNEPEDRVLLGAASIKLLRKRELEEIHRRDEYRLANPRAYELQKLVKADGLLDLGREKLHPFDSVSGSTPRYSDAALHPDSANVRTDTGFPILPATRKSTPKPGTDPTVERRRRCKPKAAISRQSDNRMRSGDDQARSSGDQESVSPGGWRLRGVSNTDVGATGGSTPAEVIGDVKATGSSDEKHDGGRPVAGEVTARSGSFDETSINYSVTPEAEEADTIGGQPTYPCSSVREREVLLRLEALGVNGARSERQKHALCLRSAYMSHSSGGEPTFTTISENVSGTVDYILFSADCLLPLEVLSIPEMGSLVGHDIQQTALVPIPGDWEPSDWQDVCGEDGYMGEWSPYLRQNRRRAKHRVPNHLFPSDHFMLMANLLYCEPRCSSTWR